MARTGPIARGDSETVEAHLAALSADHGLQELYRALGAELLDVPHRSTNFLAHVSSRCWIRRLQRPEGRRAARPRPCG